MKSASAPARADSLQYGLFFEREFGDALRRLGCQATVDERLDKEEQTDFLVTRIGDLALPPVRLQVTLTCDSLLKIAEYVRIAVAQFVPCGEHALYVEVEKGVAPDVAARAVKREVLRMRRRFSRPAIRFLRILSGGQRRAELRVRAVELFKKALLEFTGDLRVSGRVVDVHPSGFLIAVDGEAEPRWAYDADVSDESVRRLLRGHRNASCSLVGIGVSFIPVAEGRPWLRATSVISAVAAQVRLPDIL